MTTKEESVLRWLAKFNSNWKIPGRIGKELKTRGLVRTPDGYQEVYVEITPAGRAALAELDK